MEFDKFVKPLENSLQMWRQGQQKKKETAANKKKNADKGPNDTTRYLKSPPFGNQLYFCVSLSEIGSSKYIKFL